MLKQAGIDPSGPYTGESYDAAALIVLAMQASGSADRASIAKNVMSVANAPGKKIYPGELKKGLDLLAKGKAIDYEEQQQLNLQMLESTLVISLKKKLRAVNLKTKNKDRIYSYKPQR